MRKMAVSLRSRAIDDAPAIRCYIYSPEDLCMVSSAFRPRSPQALALSCSRYMYRNQSYIQ